LITGHTGFKGAWLSQWLVNLGSKVSGLSADIPTHSSLFKILKLEETIKHFFCDIRDLKNTKDSFSKVEPEIVFHLAAQPLVRRSYDQPLLTFETNII